MNTSVSPLPVPLWPMLGLSLALVAITATGVTLSGLRANQNFRDNPPLSSETAPPDLANQMMRKRADLARKAKLAL